MHSIRERLIGTWRLVSYHTLGSDGTVVHPCLHERVVARDLLEHARSQPVESRVPHMPNAHLACVPYGRNERCTHARAGAVAARGAEHRGIGLADEFADQLEPAG